MNNLTVKQPRSTKVKHDAKIKIKVFVVKLESEKRGLFC